ncbi:MAG: nucleotide exchange factor GrpE [Clostridia bacterium]|nr:nucleotide exchange factor GrpE [Clostridia bacterium]
MKEDMKMDQEGLEQEKEQGVEVEETVGDDKEETLEEIPDWESLLEQQKGINEELTNRLARLQADFDNYRRRTRKEIEEITRFGSERVILSLLPVIDNFERALAAAEGKEELAQFATGMEMIYRQMQDALAKEGLAVIPTANQPFDPEKHHAAAQVETDEYEENMIVDELQKGYSLHDKVLRPSVVRVAKAIENS